LTQSVDAHVCYDTRLSRFYHGLAKRKRKQVAAVAAGRKMLKAIYWMLKNREEFHSLEEE